VNDVFMKNGAYGLKENDDRCEAGGFHELHAYDYFLSSGIRRPSQACRPGRERIRNRHGAGAAGPHPPPSSAGRSAHRGGHSCRRYGALGRAFADSTA
jgi:hypothetical protein